MKNTLFFGNGLNQLTNNGPSWNTLLERLKGNNTFTHKTLTNTMIYEKIFLDREKPSIQKEIIIKQEIADLMKSMSGSEFYKKIIDLNFENYITTNYDYSFKNIMNKKTINENTEKIYSIRRNLKFDNGVKVWHIHGEINNPKSIQLGLDHYCGYIAKIDSYLKGTYDYHKDGKPIKTLKIEEKIANSKYDNISWIELFFNTNVHIVGLGLDYSETDLWWILNKRARLMIDNNIHNKIIFYTNWIDEEKKELFKSFKVEVKIIDKYNDLPREGEKRSTDYKNFTLDVINEISKFCSLSTYK